MSVDPTAPSTSSSAPVGTGPVAATGEELVAQSVCDLGYIAALLNAYNECANQVPPLPPGEVTSDQAIYLNQIQQMMGTINSVLNMPNIQTLDPAAYKILSFAMSSSGGGLSQLFIQPGNFFNEWQSERFLSIWANGGSLGPSDCLPQMITEWMSGTYPGQTGIPFQFNTAQDPNTTLSYLMFMSSLNLCPACQSELNAFLSQQNGTETVAQLAGQFMTAYMTNNCTSEDSPFPEYAMAPVLGYLSSTPNFVGNPDQDPSNSYNQFVSEFLSGSSPYYCGWVDGNWWTPYQGTVSSAESSYFGELKGFEQNTYQG